MDTETIVRSITRQAEIELDWLYSHLQGLNEQRWQAPSACEGWSVREVVDHLGSGSLYFREMLEVVLAGQEAPVFSPEARKARALIFKDYTNDQATQAL